MTLGFILTPMSDSSFPHIDPPLTVRDGEPTLYKTVVYVAFRGRRVKGSDVLLIDYGL